MWGSGAASNALGWVGVLVGVLVGVWVGASTNSIAPAEAIQWSWTKARYGLQLTLLVVGLVVVFGQFLAPPDDPDVLLVRDLTRGLEIGLLCTVSIGIVFRLAGASLVGGSTLRSFWWSTRCSPVCCTCWASGPSPSCSTVRSSGRNRAGRTTRHGRGPRSNTSPGRNGRHADLPTVRQRRQHRTRTGVRYTAAATDPSRLAGKGAGVQPWPVGVPSPVIVPAAPTGNVQAPPPAIVPDARVGRFEGPPPAIALDARTRMPIGGPIVNANTVRPVPMPEALFVGMLAGLAKIGSAIGVGAAEGTVVGIAKGLGDVITLVIRRIFLEMVALLVPMGIALGAGW